ncbi:uncharacterized protein LOC113404061 [Vanessa tameamea]|uniref:Uncharacterized protein LOC113404061 n=1 Tax=Vanessa tameamea TaxID=334116 RepID=A0A8B8ITW7_VANTA|nr:uncharacterized protein LOC113404061 [Vanessa tameamea]
MDQPSGSNASFAAEAMDTDVPKKSNLVRRASSLDRAGRARRSKVDASKDHCFAKNIQSLIVECEMRIRGYLKLQRLATAAQDYNIFDVDDDSSNSSNISLNSSAENIFADTIAPRPRFQRKEKSTIGSWLFLSSVEGGWSYENTKSFLLKVYGVKCLRSRTLSDRLAMEGDFKAIVKFRTSEELNRIVMSLKHRKITDKFIFLSFDKMPIPYDESDSESEEETRLNPLSMIPKGI